MSSESPTAPPAEPPRIDSADVRRSERSGRGAHRTSVVVINYNGRDYLEPCLRALLEQEPRPEQVLVVDNESQDDSVPYLREHFPEVKVLEAGGNLGPAAARNLGMKAAEHPRVLLIDNDVVMRPGCLEALHRALDRDDVVVAQARSVMKSDPSQLHYDRADLQVCGTLVLHDWFRSVDEVDRERSEPAEGSEVGAFIALCLLVDRDEVLEIGGFDERLFILYEDNDLSWRLRMRGRRLWRAKNAVVLHDDGTAGLSFRGEGKSYSPQRTFLHVRNRGLVVLRNASLSNLLLMAPARAVYAFAYFVFAVLRGHLGDVLRGYLAILAALPRVVSARRRTQRTRTVPDRNLLSARGMTANPGLADRGPKAWLRRAIDLVIAGYWKVVRPLCG
ncbi:MAG: glycosyltransferase family 2 protein [Planctomycetota bacterium]